MRTRNYRQKWLLHTRIVIGFRPYRTIRRYRRPFHGPQLIIPTYLLLRPTKEIILQIQAVRGASRRPRHRLSPQSRQSLSFGLLTLGMALLIVFSQVLHKSPETTLIRAFSVPAPPRSQSAIKPKGLSASKPVSIGIKSLDVESKLISLGQNADKTIETPPLEAHRAGWYRHSPTPGEVGPSVIVGHVDTLEGPSVFYRLKDIKAGAVVEIKRADGSLAKFEVTGLEQFSQNKFPTKSVYGNINHAGLRLITCSGDFNAQTGKYSQNIVVFAKLINS